MSGGRRSGRASPAEVCMFTDTVGFGGAEQMLLTVAAALDPARWRVVLVHHPDGDHGPMLARADELAIERWVVPRMPDGPEGARCASRGSSQAASTPASRLPRASDLAACLQIWPAGSLVARVPAVVASVQLFPRASGRRC